MFDIGFWELALVAVIALIVLGPERLPVVARTAGRWVGKMRSYIRDWTSQMESEMDVGDLREEVKGLRRELDEARQKVTSETRGVVDDIEGIRADTRKVVDDIEADGRDVMDEIEHDEHDNPSADAGDSAANSENDGAEKASAPDVNATEAAEQHARVADDDEPDEYAAEDSFRSADQDLAEYGEQQPFSLERARAERARKNQESQL